VLYLSRYITGYKLVQENDETKDDPQQLLVIDYNSQNFGQVLQGKDRNWAELFFDFLLFV